jgi:hypothetical protein
MSAPLLRSLRLGAIATASIAATVALGGITRANAPPGRYTVAGGIVYDTKTKLTWQQAVPATTYTWSDAMTMCSTLNLGGTGWRLPTVKELMTIYDVTQPTSPAIDSTAFPGTPAGHFWSSTPLAYKVNSVSYAWNVDFVAYGGADNGTPVSSATGYARCVR